MPLCGFNAEMIDGLRCFGVGLSTKEGDVTFCGFNQDMHDGLDVYAKGLIERHQKEEKMTICGFNERMHSGMRQFGEGLGRQAAKRAQDDGLTMRESVDSELAEMQQMLARLTPDTIRKEALFGCVHLARALYRPCEGLDDPTAAYAKNLEEILTFLVECDRLYYDELRPGRSQEEAVTLLLERIEHM